MKRSPYRAIGVHVLLLLAVGAFLMPLVWMVLTSLKPKDRTLISPPDWLPRATMASLKRTPDGNPERMPVEVVRELSEREVLVIGGLSAKEKPGQGQYDGLRVLVKAADVRSDGKWGEDLAPGPGTMRMKQGIEAELHEFPCKIIAIYEAPEKDASGAPANPWCIIREYVADLRQTSSTDASLAWDLVRKADVQAEVRALWQNYPAALNKMDFWSMFLNTLWICILGMIGTTVVSALAAYGFAFGTFPGKKVAFALTLATMMVPFSATMVPMYKLYREAGWIGTFKPLWVHCWFGAAFNIFLLRQFFMGLPKDLLDAARIDGCTELEIFWHVVIPLSRPALAMVALFHFLYAWKDFMAPLLFLSDKSQFTLSLGLQSFQSQQGGTPWHLVMAAAAVFSIPLILLFLLTMKTFIKGIATTGIKG